MFDFLNKPTHHHQISQKVQENPSIYISQSNDFKNQMIDSQIKYFLNKSSINKSPKKQIKQIANVKKYQRNNPSALDPQTAGLFYQMLLQSKNIHNNFLIQNMIQKHQRMIQKRVYTRETATNLSYYLHQLFQKVPIENQITKSSIDDLINGTVQNILDDIQTDNCGYQIFNKKRITKDDLAQLQKMDQIRMIKKKQGELSSKVGQLKMELNFSNFDISSKAKQIIQKDIYDNDHIKTKQAQKYVQMKKNQRQQYQKKKQQFLQKKKIKQIQKKIKQEQENQKLKAQKHAKLVQKLEAKKQLKLKQQEQRLAQRKKFAQFLKQYKKAKPLYQQKMQQQIKKQLQQKKQRYAKMSNRKGYYNPIDLQQLQEFEFKYLQLKRQNQQRKKIQIEIQKNQQKYRIQEMKDKQYKGKFRYLILQQMIQKKSLKKSQEFTKNLLVDKKKSYSIDVRERFKPKIDEKKRIQSERFVMKTQRKRKQKGPRRVRIDSADFLKYQTILYDQNQAQVELDPYKQGIKNLKRFKQYIHQKIQKGQVKKPQNDVNNQNQSYIPKIDYLKEKRQIRQTKNNSFSYRSLDAESRIRKLKKQTNGDINMFKLKADQFDQKVRRQQLKIKYSQHTPFDQKQLQQDYLSSIKAKLQLLSNCK